MRQVVVEGKRPNCSADQLHVRVQPSPDRGVLIAVNQHYQLETAQRAEVRDRHKEAIRVLQDDWTSFVNYAHNVALKLLLQAPSTHTWSKRHEHRNPQTSSRVDDRDVNSQTRGVHIDDWVLSEIEPEQRDMGETTTRELNAHSSNGSATTMPTDSRKVSEPIRKDTLVIRFPSDHVKLLQQWECVILRVRDDCVECEMHDLTDESEPVEYAEVYLDEFNRFDKALLCEGAVFYWSIGHKTKRTGQVRRYSELRVRRMPHLSNLTKRDIHERAKQFRDSFQQHMTFGRRDEIRLGDDSVRAGRWRIRLASWQWRLDDHRLMYVASGDPAGRLGLPAINWD